MLMFLENLVVFFLISPGSPPVFRAAVNAIINYLSDSQTIEGANSCVLHAVGT